MIQEFKTFIMRGSVIDLAVGIVIGTAFGKIITSLVTDVIMPPIGLLLHGVDFSNLFISLNGQAFTSLADAQKAGAPTLNYGNFINNIIIFLIIAVVVFLIIRAINRLQRPAPAAPASTKECRYCFTVIPIKATRCPNCTSELK
jgi:large conductance mechanosensitive channel